jgi:DNA replication and repair protein RecF
VPGLVVVVGKNGVGKTNLLEAIHVGSQGFSPRTRAEARLVRFGQEAARVSLSVQDQSVAVSTQVTIAARDKRVLVNGAATRGPDELRGRLATLIFLPDRLAVVKGGPLVRRAYIDRMLGRVFPSRAGLSSEYSRSLAQRNEALRRVRSGASSLESLEPWTERVAALGTELDAARAELVASLAQGFQSAGETLGLTQLELAYDPRPLTEAQLAERLERDVERGLTGAGPHLRDVGIAAGGRELRSFGSQGEQRAAVLALVLAEAGLSCESRGEPPLLLLDDVLSELDGERRRALLDALPPGGQSVVTTTSTDALPAGAGDAALVVEVTPGEARAA